MQAYEISCKFLIMRRGFALIPVSEDGCWTPWMDGLPPGWMDPPGGFGQDASNALDRAQAEPRIYPSCQIREEN